MSPLNKLYPYSLLHGSCEVAGNPFELMLAPDMVRKLRRDVEALD
ncbi:hypothetical protein [Paraburkholderia terrae]